MSRLQTWDDQVRVERSKPVAIPTDPALLALLERIATASERTSRRVGIIEWLMLLPIVLAGAVVAIGFMYR